MFHIAFSEADMKMVRTMLNPIAACEATCTAAAAEPIESKIDSSGNWRGKVV